MLRKWMCFLLVACSCQLFAQDALQYQKPSKEILDLVDVTLAPTTLVDDAQQNMLLLFRDNYKSIEDLSKEELRLAGLRIDPTTNIGSRVTYYNDLQVQRVGSKDSLTIKGMPETPRLTNFTWSPNQRYMAFTHTAKMGVELWVLDIEAAEARKLFDKPINANMGDTLNWNADSSSLLVKVVPKDRKNLIDTSVAVPTGPTISVSDGKKAQNRTYQDLLKNKNDEFNFEQLARSEIYKVPLKGKASPWLASGMYGDVSVSPAGDYVMVDDAQQNMLLLFRDNYKSIEDLSKEELRLAGLRIDPTTNIGSRVTYYNDLQVQRVGSKDSLTIKGMPETPRLTNFTWSPNQRYMAFTHTAKMGVELWVLDIEAAEARKLFDKPINANMGDTLNWNADSSSLLVKVVPKDRKNLIDTSVAVPTGPTISVSDGKKAQNRTYQDLLKNKNDEFNFEQLARSEIYKVPLKGKASPWLASGMYGDVSVSPAGDYVMVEEYKPPFSYLVTYRRFPHTISLYSKNGTLAKTLVDVPLIEDLPQGFMAVRTGPRDVQWRNDKPNTIVYAEALDGGDPEVEVTHRDKLMQLEAPFNGEAEQILKTEDRFYRFIWNNDSVAIAMDYWWNTRNNPWRCKRFSRRRLRDGRGIQAAVFLFSDLPSLPSHY